MQAVPFYGPKNKATTNTVVVLPAKGRNGTWPPLTSTASTFESQELRRFIGEHYCCMGTPEGLLHKVQTLQEDGMLRQAERHQDLLDILVILSDCCINNNPGEREEHCT